MGGSIEESLVVLEKERKDALKSLRKLGLVQLEDVQGTRNFIVRLPWMEEEDIQVKKEDGDLILTVRNETRRFHLPDRVSRRYVSGWTYDGEELTIHMDYD